MDRPRVLGLLDRVWRVPLTLIVAPAGSGKTTAAAQFSAAALSAGRKVAWYRTEPSDRGVTDVLRFLDAATARAFGALIDRWSSVEGAAAAMEGWSYGPTAVVIDDLHNIECSAGEVALGRLIDYLPSGVHIVVLARRPPKWNLSRWRVSGQLNEIGPEELRFRAWEADLLFRDHYRAPIPPDELGELLRRTDGWAAGLRLFRLATEGRGGDDRRRQALSTLSYRLPTAREYIDRNVLDSLDDTLRAFLIHTSVLGRLSSQWCDELLGRAGSNRILDEAIQRHRLLTVDDGGGRHCSEVVRGRLEELLIEELGESGSRDLHRRAGHILEAGRAWPEALRAYSRAEDWESVATLIGRAGENALDGWVGPMPPVVPAGEAWRMLAKARGCLFAGHWQAAAGLYGRAEETCQGLAPVDTCRRELQTITSWNDPTAPTTNDWAGLLRDGLRRGTTVLTPAHGSGPNVNFAMGLAAVAAGDFARGIGLIEAAAGGDVSRPIAAYAGLAAAAARVLVGKVRPDDVRAAAEGIQGISPTWLPRLVLALLPDGLEPADLPLASMRREAEEGSNEWVAAAATFVQALLVLWSEKPAGSASLFVDVAERLARLDAPILQAWALGLAALALSSTDVAAGSRQACAAAQLAGAVGCPGAVELADAVRSAGTVAVGTQDMSLSSVLLRRVIGVGPHHAWGGCLPPDRPTVTVRCFGGFVVTIGGVEVNPKHVKPRAWTVLKILALQPGRPIHRDRLVAALWPDDPSAAGIRNLQVAVSSLRRMLEPNAGRGDARIIVRSGDNYVLEADPTAVDIVVFEQEATAGRRLAEDGAKPAAVSHLRRAIATYGGELHPEVGPADWVVEEQDRYRLLAAGCAQTLAACLVDLNDIEGAVAACEWGLQVDRYRDGLWRTLIAAYERDENTLAATRARRGYEKILCELDVHSV